MPKIHGLKFISNVKKRMPRVGFVIFGCLTLPKYYQQVLDCWSTWCADALKHDCPVYFYTGPTEVEGIPEDLKARCIDCEYGDSYFSATYKQWIGLDHITTKEPDCDFYFLCGTDTYIRIPELLRRLETIDPKQPLQIGGGLMPTAFKETRYSYFSGGAGILLSRAASLIIQPVILSFLEEWLDTAWEPVRIEHSDGTVWEANILFACDAALGVLCVRLEIPNIELGDSIMYGAGNHQSEILDKVNWISCHLMTHDNFMEMLHKHSL
jgi:hypothetical protein